MQQGPCADPFAAAAREPWTPRHSGSGGEAEAPPATCSSRSTAEEVAAVQALRHEEDGCPAIASSDPAACDFLLAAIAFEAAYGGAGGGRPGGRAPGEGVVVVSVAAPGSGGGGGCGGCGEQQQQHGRAPPAPVPAPLGQPAGGSMRC